MDFHLPQLGEGVYEAELVRWLVHPGDAVRHGQGLVEVLTDKATMEVPAPFAGTVRAFNAALLGDPSAINADTYGDGWLFEMDGVTDPGMTAAEYHAFLAEAWVTAQRVIKNQINTPDDD